MRKEPSMLNAKIADHHLARQACIYIRQSTMAQVRLNQESTERQYNLANQAKSLGWTPEQIRILDGDLAQSGQQTTRRDDFKTLVSDVAMGQVGAIFSLENRVVKFEGLKGRKARYLRDLLHFCRVQNLAQMLDGKDIETSSAALGYVFI